jgi:hypothetical protein
MAEVNEFWEVAIDWQPTLEQYGYALSQGIIYRKKGDTSSWWD